MTLLFLWGVVSPADVIEWSDSQVSAIYDPPIALLELSSAPPSNWGAILTYLNILSQEGDFWKALRTAMPRLYEYVTTHPSDAERIANELYRTVVISYPEDVPPEFDFIYHFDDAFLLAQEGVYGDPKAVYDQFATELRRFV